MTTITLTDGYAIHTNESAATITRRVEDSFLSHYIHITGTDGTEYAVNPTHIIAIERGSAS